MSPAHSIHTLFVLRVLPQLSGDAVYARANRRTMEDILGDMVLEAENLRDNAARECSRHYLRHACNVCGSECAIRTARSRGECRF